MHLTCDGLSIPFRLSSNVATPDDLLAMRLLQLRDGGKFSLIERVGNNIPPYAILSHTWGSDDEEFTFKDLIEGKGTEKLGYRKLTFCSQQAAYNGLQYIWIDTCCIDKSSSSELSEAINSMFRWYQNAHRCYVYLSDVAAKISGGDGYGGGDEGDGEVWSLAFKRSRWFTRGWTLQELIAPQSVEFFASGGQRLGDKQSLEQTLHEITGISVTALQGSCPLSQFSIDERMKWAERRETKREEDMAYSLLGIFGIHMPLLYGEGKQKALTRLHKGVRDSLRDPLTHLGREFTGLGPSKDHFWSPNPSDETIVGKHQPSSRGSNLGVLSEEHRKELMTSLHFKQRDARLLTLKSAQTKTCRWLLKNVHYKDWMNADKLKQHHGFFWIKGKPGTGKSIMMKFLFSEAKRSMKDSLVLSFFFNARGEALEKSTSGLYRALLLQLLEKAPETCGILDCYGTHMFDIIKDSGWQNETLRDLFSRALQGLGNGRVVCFVDALDECPEDDVRDMVSFFEELGEIEKAAEFRVCFSSRHYPEISIRTGLQLALESEQDHTNDLSLYINTQLKLGTSTQAEDVKAEILRKSSGIFLWISLVIPILNKEYDRGRIKALKRRLGEIPAGLHELFLDMLTRDHKNVDELLVCIQVVLFAARPLKPEELRIAIETCCGGNDDLQYGRCVDPTEMTPESLRKFVLDASKGLAEITRSKEPTVQFIHESVRDFLLKEGGLSKLSPTTGDEEARGHNTLKSICSRQLSSHSQTSCSCDASILEGYFFSSEQSKVWIKDHPLIHYAVDHIFYHANWAQKLGLDQSAFLTDFNTYSWVRLRCITHCKKNDLPTKLPGTVYHLLYYLSEYGSDYLIRIHSDRNKHFELRGRPHGLPLVAALYAGHRAAARAFVDLPPLPDEGSTQVPAAKLGRELALRKENYTSSRRPLSFLCEFGDTDILRTVLEKGYFSLDTTTTAECLEYASSEAVVDMLAGFGAFKRIIPEATTDVKVSPFVLPGEEPVCSTLTNIEQSLKKYPVLINRFYVTGHGSSLLEYAAAKGFQNIARLCVKFTDVDERRSAFMSAVRGRINQNGRMAIIKCLGEPGIQSSDESNGNLAWILFEAILQSHNEDVINLVLSTSSLDLETSAGGGFTVLLWAIDQGRKTYVKLFLSAGANPMSRTEDGATALILAAKLSDLSSFRCILENSKCEPDARDKNGRTALSWCATVADDCAIRMAQDLLDRNDVDPNSTDNSGRTVLMRAVQSGNRNMVNALLSSPDIDPDHGPHGKSTPLRLALKLFREEGHRVFLEITEQLLWTSKANPRCRKKLPTPAEIARGCGSKEVEELFEKFEYAYSPR
ncbi:hypothetical protein N0V83_000235 [Neocucurbitaria cava]|uniref:Heterokaryon incompatibility domain-containing protein n=1 Tax=Neocucurbitaria cava TaxID=798079 RepID=A0A9W8YG00_9PLEO|nr:hypothetical protein N0V83_000235 [Neocucurbitaria cava]